MAFDDDFLKSVDDLYLIAGVDCEYTAKGVAAQTIQAIIEFDMLRWGNEVQVAGGSAVISMRKSEVPEKPRREETLAISGTTYRVDQVIQSDDLEHVVLVT